jgi:hypothetical protein
MDIQALARFTFKAVITQGKKELDPDAKKLISGVARILGEDTLADWVSEDDQPKTPSESDQDIIDAEFSEID